NRDGTLDTTFGGDGKVTTDFLGDCPTPDVPLCGSDFAQAVAVQPDGRIVVAGYDVVDAIDPIRGNINTDFALARYNADGTLDTTFGGDGKVTTDFLGSPDPHAVSLDAVFSLGVQSDGKIVAAGRADTGSGFGFAVARYNGD